MKQTLTLAAPYHDPDGCYNSVFQELLSQLKRNFTHITLSVTPSTKENNYEFLQFLEKNGVYIFYNKQRSSVSNHSINALRTAFEGSKDKIFFGFIDRILYSLALNRQDFINSLGSAKEESCVIFQRSEKAWSTHPDNYRQVEKMVSGMLQLLAGKDLELNPCAFLFDVKTAKTLVDQSKTQGWSIWGEWVLLILKNRIPYTAINVDWLSWEDPFWEKEELPVLKSRKESSPEETLKRLQMNLPIANLLQEERFLSIFKVV